MSVQLGEERDTLHAIASPLAAAIFTLEDLIQKKNETDGQTGPDLPALEQIMRALEAVQKILEDRRNTLGAKL